MSTPPIVGEKLIVELDIELLRAMSGEKVEPSAICHELTAALEGNENFLNHVNASPDSFLRIELQVTNQLSFEL